MDLSTVSTLLSSFGFPVVMCGVMAWYVKYSTDKSREEVTSLNKQHASEMTEVTMAINNNTLALQKLCDKMGE